MRHAPTSRIRCSGARLQECCALLLQATGIPAVDIFGDIDAMKLRSCLTLFEAVSPQTPIFGACLDRFFAGERDALTTALLAR